MSKINTIFLAFMLLIMFTGCTVNEEKLKEIKSIAIVNITIDRELEIKNDDYLSYLFEPAKILNILSNPSQISEPISTEEIETYIIISNLINDFFRNKFDVYVFDQAKLARDDYYNSFSKDTPKQLGKEYYVVPPYKYIDLSNILAKDNAKLICEHLKTDAIISLLLTYRMDKNSSKATLTPKIVLINKDGEVIIDNTYIVTEATINGKIQNKSNPTGLVALLAEFQKIMNNSSSAKHKAYILATQKLLLNDLNSQFKDKEQPLASS